MSLRATPTFDVNSTNPAHNLKNCAMAMDANRNLRAESGSKVPVHFWCEAGSFRA